MCWYADCCAEWKNAEIHAFIINSAYRSSKKITGLGLRYATANKVISSTTSFFLNTEKTVGKKANVRVEKKKRTIVILPSCRSAVVKEKRQKEKT